MMTRLLALLLLAAALPLSAADKKRPVKDDFSEPNPLYEVTYRFTPVWHGSDRHLAIEATFQAGPRDETVLNLPDQFGAGRDLVANIRNLRSLTPGVVVMAGDTPATRKLKHEPSRKVTIAYEVTGKPDQRIEHKTFYDPIYRADWFQVFGHAVIIAPAYLDKGLVNLNIEWHGIPGHWKLAGSHGVKGTGAVTRWRKEGVALAQARHAVYVGGDFRLHKVMIKDRPLYIALRGKWSFTDAAFVEATQRVVEAHRAFWDDFDFPFYLITVIPNDLERGSSGGTAIRDAFSMNVSRDFSVPGDAFDFLIGHEHLHTWVPGKLGKLLEGANEGQSYWFSEGFTNYLTHRLLVKAGVWTPQRYATALNEVIRRYLASGALAMDNADVAANFWKRRDAGDMPYQRGELIALRWNAALNRKGKSLDEVLKAMRPRHPTLELATERLAKALAKDIAGVQDDLQRFIEKGEVAQFTPDFLGPCFELRAVPLAEFDLGLDAEASIAAKKVIGLREDSNAYRAGLRNGMLLRGYSVNYGDPEKDASISVQMEGETTPKAFVFRPARDTKREVPQYFLKPGAADEAGCKAWF